MATSRSTPPPTPQAFVSYLGSGNGIGSPPPETDAERLARIEDMLIRMQTVLETQFLLMADMQVLIGRLTAEPRREQAVSGALASSVLRRVVLCPQCRSDALKGTGIGPDLRTVTVRCSECCQVSVITVSE
jgi:hypothetical protein